MRQLVFITLFVFTLGCTNSTLEDPTAVLQSEIIELTPGKSDLLYKSQDTTTITARIPKDAGHLDVKFTATHGTFVASNSNTVNQYADSIAGNYRFATVLFTSDTTQTTVYITAETGSVRARATITFIK